MAGKTFQVTFHYDRYVTVFLEADEEDDILDFLEETDWDPIEDDPEMIDSDETESDGDFVIEPTEMTANYAVENGRLVEVEQ